MNANMWVILVSAAVALAIGGIWYGPFFGKLWLEISGASEADMAAREAMRKETGTLYLVQFALTVVQLHILSDFIGGAWDTAEGIKMALMIWLGFVVPTIAGIAMWNAKPAKVRLTMFFLSAGYQFVCFLIFGIILSLWQ